MKFIQHGPELMVKKRPGLAALGLPVLLLMASCEPSVPPKPVDFTTQIKPILESQCVNCHQSGALLGNVNLQDHALATRPHPHGQVIVPGDPDHSLLYQVLVLSEKAKQAMPPGGHRVDKDKANLIKHWILQGAHWPDGPEGVIRPAVNPAEPVGKRT